MINGNHLEKIIVTYKTKCYHIKSIPKVTENFLTIIFPSTKYPFPLNFHSPRTRKEREMNNKNTSCCLLIALDFSDLLLTFNNFLSFAGVDIVSGNIQ